MADLFDVVVARKLSGGGGGGSSDFSEAKIAINVNLPEGETVRSIEVASSFYYKDEQVPFTGRALVDENNIASVLMYEGQGFIEQIAVRGSGYYYFNPDSTTASGDIVWDPNVGYYGGWLVTGDGSLTTTFSDDED